MFSPAAIRTRRDLCTSSPHTCPQPSLNPFIFIHKPSDHHPLDNHNHNPPSLLHHHSFLLNLLQPPAVAAAQGGGPGVTMHSEPAATIRQRHSDVDHYPGRYSTSSIATTPRDRSSPDGSPCTMSPWHQTASSIPPQSWSYASDDNNNSGGTSLIGSLVREEGHIYSLAAVNDLLYTGSDSKNIRVWKNQKEFSAFKSTSGLVKAIVIAGDRIFTGHQDGKIRVWKVSPKNPSIHKRIGTLPRLRDFIKSSLKPSNYVEIRRHRTALWIKHADAISCLSFSEDQGLLYSGSWDKTFKVWRIADSKCLESVVAHDDAVNSVVAAFDGLVFTGSADGTVKVWRRELQGKGTKHAAVQTLLKHDCAVTALAVSNTAPVLYAGSSDGLVNFWEGERHHTHGGELRGHKMAVLCLAAAGSLLLSGSADKTICVWRREGCMHTCLSVLTGHGGPVKCLAVEADRSGGGDDGGDAAARWILYSGSLDKSVKVWRVSEQTPEALLQGPQNVPVGPDEVFGGANPVGQELEGMRTRVPAAA